MAVLKLDYPEPTTIGDALLVYDWYDTSWHNDVAASASTVFDDAVVHLWVHPDQPSDREWPNAPKYAATYIPIAEGNRALEAAGEDLVADAELGGALSMYGLAEQFPQIEHEDAYSIRTWIKRQRGEPKRTPEYFTKLRTETWATNNAKFVREAFLKAGPKRGWDFTEADLERQIVPASSERAQRVMPRGLKDEADHHGPNMVLVFTEPSGEGVDPPDPYSDIAPYTDAHDLWEAVIDSIMATGYFDDAGWDSWNPAFNYVWLEPKIIG